jgi:hypothetical protein
MTIDKLYDPDPYYYESDEKYWHAVATRYTEKAMGYVSRSDEPWSVNFPDGRTMWCASHELVLDPDLNPDFRCYDEDGFRTCDVMIQPAFQCGQCKKWSWWRHWVAEITYWTGDQWAPYYDMAYGSAHYSGADGSPLHPRLKGQQRHDGRCPYCLYPRAMRSSEYGSEDEYCEDAPE